MQRPMSLLVLFTAAVVASLTSASIAGAHHTDNVTKTANYQANCSSSALCQTDNSTLTFFRQSSLNSTSQQNVWNVLYDKYNPTDLTVVHENPPSYTGGAETDIIYQVNGDIYPSIGRTICDDPIDGTKCDQHFVYFVDNSWASNDAVACHETGHAIGFTHGQQASPAKANDDQSLECMAVPSPYVLNGHSVPQINSTY